MRTLAPYSHFFNCYSKDIQGEIFPPQTSHALRGLTKCNHFYFFISFSHFDRVLVVNIFLLLQNIWICCLHHILGINLIVVLCSVLNTGIDLGCWCAVGGLKYIKSSRKPWSSWPPFQCLVTHPYMILLMKMFIFIHFPFKFWSTNFLFTA